MTEVWLCGECFLMLGCQLVGWLPVPGVVDGSDSLWWRRVDQKPQDLGVALNIPSFGDLMSSLTNVCLPAPVPFSRPKCREEGAPSRLSS